MKKRTMQMFLYAGAAFASVCLLCWIATAEERQPEPGRHDTRNDDINKLLPLAYAKLKKVDVYGKVIDQWMNGVPDADVCISGHTADWMIGKRDKPYEVWAKTDKDGLFHAVLKYPNKAHPSASKNGYELVGRYYTDLVKHRTTAENPVVLQMRKKGEITFLVKKLPGTSRSRTMLLTKGTNGLTRAWDMLMNITNEKPPSVEYADLLVDGVYDVNKKAWTLTIGATNGTDGLVLDTKLLHEAPLDGYVKQCAFQVANEYSQTQYVYLRSRSPTVYSRIELTYDLCRDPGKSDYLRVLYDFCMNPYGERSFEFDERSDSVFSLADTLRREALEAFAAGRYPEKPKDMGKLAEETRGRVKREQEESSRRQREWQEQQRKQRETKAK
jgi:hypothetical protein